MVLIDTSVASRSFALRKIIRTRGENIFVVRNSGRMNERTNKCAVKWDFGIILSVVLTLRHTLDKLATILYVL